MASILDLNSFQSSSPNILQQGQQPNQQDIASQARQLAKQIAGAPDSVEMFKKTFGNNPQAKQALDIIAQYGNGNAKTAFENYVASSGKQAAGDVILQQLGLK